MPPRISTLALATCLIWTQTGSCRARRERLKPAEGDKVERLARLMAMAEAVWEDREDARSFMNEEHPRFEGRTPIEMADTELGARRVEDLLMKLEYGLPA